jgi:hypothetical protein
MNDLFCTPEQGQRLKELLHELESVMVWKFSNWKNSYSQKPMYLEDYWDHHKISSKYKNIDAVKQHSFKVGFIAPALTLQELRDVAIKHGMDISDLEDHLYSSTAPKLADWVIARLE